MSLEAQTTQIWKQSSVFKYIHFDKNLYYQKNLEALPMWKSIIHFFL